MLVGCNVPETAVLGNAHTERVELYLKGRHEAKAQTKGDVSPSPVAALPVSCRLEEVLTLTILVIRWY
jgi:hypothetical protein